MNKQSLFVQAPVLELRVQIASRKPKDPELMPLRCRSCFTRYLNALLDCMMPEESGIFAGLHAYRWNEVLLVCCSHGAFRKDLKNEVHSGGVPK